VSLINKKILNLQFTTRAVVLLSTAMLLASTVMIDVQAQPDPEVAIDRAFRFESSSRQGALIASLKGWMGSYQRIIKEENNYLAIFDRGSIPVGATFTTSGSLETILFGCPKSKSISINDAPEGIRQELSKCAGFKS
jgi:hypothetical protein